MKIGRYIPPKQQRSQCGLTLIEMLIATGIGLIMMTIILSLTAYGERSFAVTSSHVNLESKSRNALDKLTRELHQATAVINCETNLPVKSLTVTNALEAFTMTLSWDADAKTLTLERTGPTIDDNQSVKLLTNCDRWDFTLCGRAPIVGPTDVSFSAAATLADCKLIVMSWSCSQNVIGKLETENVQEAQIGLRNKVN
jgi:prepilin-type N-terminal cleavage/methylation domain-containing protein